MGHGPWEIGDGHGRLKPNPEIARGALVPACRSAERRAPTANPGPEHRHPNAESRAPRLIPPLAPSK